MNHRELRRTFLEFFAERGHKIVPSSALIPRDDPSLLFTSAGMVQFKPYWAGAVEPPYRRACSIQKCLRASDLDQVGHTSRHHTFFEMMGNFSFGDYFKAEAIPWAWEYVTAVVKLDPARLWASIFEEDDEAFEIWVRKVGLSEARVVRLGAKDNFWGPAGATGACGPCSEIYYDFGPGQGCGRPDCRPGCDCDRFIEFYNNVFPQFNQLPDGTREPLKNRGIDTGMGLERLAMISQGKRTVFETDLFAPVIRESALILGVEVSDENRVMFNVCADHARALVFAIADGVIPSNEARGYVLRGILRRALVFAHRAGVREPFLYRVAGAVAEHMKQWYPELAAKREQAALIIKSEEDRFLRTLEDGLERWESVLGRCRADGFVPGIELFRLHDTYGFHIELVKELAAAAGVELDLAGFESAMLEQRERSKSRSAIDTAGAGALDEALSTGEQWHETVEVTDAELDRFEPLKDGEYELHLAKTPFYPEAGGQVGDTGEIEGSGFKLAVVASYRKQGVPVVRAKLVAGEVAAGTVTARVDFERRREIERAHTATHLLHAALRRVVGDYVKQEGSLVEPGRLRFDFAAFEPLTMEQVQAVERMVYEQVLADKAIVRRTEVPLEDAKKLGALAFFGEQYGERVTVVGVPGFSMELCGGTHLARTGQIGHFRITSETGVAAGIRRIEALVGRAAQQQAGKDRMTLDLLREKLGAGEDSLVRRVEGLTEELKRLEARVRSLSSQLAHNAADELADRAEELGGVRVAVGWLPQLDVDGLRLVADRVRERLGGRHAGFLAGGLAGSRLSYVVFVSDDLRQVLPAGRLAKVVGAALGGGGGGRPDFASGGGEADRLEAGREAFRAAVRAAEGAGNVSS
ncbi:MAG: alanine--tRNA ligase [bacterium]